MKYIAIGDIHGCLTQLEEILFLTKNFPNHKLVFLGDYIDRGLYSNEVLDLIRYQDAICLLGNHELMFLEMVDSFAQAEANIFINFLERKKISNINYEWMKSALLTHYETEEYFFSHAGLNPNKPLELQNENDFLWTYFEGSYNHITNKLVVQGHVRGEKVRIKDNHYSIDTGCGMGGYLSALVLPEKIILQSKTKSPEYERFKNFDF